MVLLSGVAATFGGCCSNVYALEKILTTESHAGTLITFCQFLFISVVSWLQLADFKHYNARSIWINPPKIPLRRYFVSIALHFIVSTLNNYVFKFQVSVPFHTIFRSLGTSVTIVIGTLFFGKRYTFLQNLGSVLVSLGVTICTLSGSGSGFQWDDFKVDCANGPLWSSLIGISLLFLATCLNSVMGLYSEESYRRYGKVNSTEVLFYSNFYALPLFALISSELRHELQIISDPEVYKWIFTNCLTQYVCVWGVNTLAVATSSLTVSLILMIRKFVSLAISFQSFNNNFIRDSDYYLGIILVILGTLIYSLSSKIHKDNQKANVTRGKKHN